MSVTTIRSALTAARSDGKVSVDEVDRIMLKARDDGGLDFAERHELLKATDTFDDAAKQRVLTHLSVMGQKNAWVDIDVSGQVTSIQGRYANLSVGVPGLSARVGMFDNAFSLRGAAAKDGVLKLELDGTTVQVPVKKGQRSSEILKALDAALPAQFKGVLLSGDVQPYDPALYTGRSVASPESAAHLMLYKPAALELKPGELPMRVMVTGYGAFMGITNNPSANMAQRLAEQGVKGAIVEYRRLEVTPAAVDAFIAEMRKAPPDVILSMGVGGQAQVEERPENRLGAGTDGHNQLMAEREVRPGGPLELRTDLPVDTIEWSQAAFAANRQVFTSRSDQNYQPDRSAYLCNYLGYNLAAEYGASQATTAGFMHINDGTPVEQMHEVLKAVTAKQLEWRREHGTTAPARPNS